MSSAQLRIKEGPKGPEAGGSTGKGSLRKVKKSSVLKQREKMDLIKGL